MAIIDDKKSILTKVSTVKKLNERTPKTSNFNSLGSVDNSTDTTKFLIDFLNILQGASKIKDVIVNIFTYELPRFESDIKTGLKKEIKKMVSCDINPSIPEWLKSDGEGIELKVDNIDFFETMKVNPTTTSGRLLFTDVPNKKNSSDFNTFLNYTIQDPNTTNSWGSSVFGNGKDILNVKFIESNPNGNNNIIKINSAPGYDDKTLTDLNNDFIDSISLFGNPGSLDSKTIFNQLLEDLYSSISFSPDVNKSKKQLLKEAEIKEVLECIINSEDNVISNDFFQFSNPSIGRMANDVENKSRGIVELKTCGNLAVQILEDTAVNTDTLLDSSTSKADEAKNVSNSLDNIAKTQSNFSQNSIDKPTIELNFFIELIQNLTKIIATTLITPKFVSVFAINHQIIYGKDNPYNGGVDFIRKNKTLIKSIVKIIKNLIVAELLKLVIKNLTELLITKITFDNIEKQQNYLNVINSLITTGPKILEGVKTLIEIGKIIDESN
jgi:hypothetical protein